MPSGEAGEDTHCCCESDGRDEPEEVVVWSVLPLIVVSRRVGGSRVVAGVVV